MSKSNFSISALLLSLVVMLNFSCVKEDEITNDKEYPELLVFGTFNTPNSCTGSDFCVEIYKADASGLTEDVLDTQPSGDTAYPGQFTHSLSITAYQNVMDFFTANPIPEELLVLPNGSVGTFNDFGQNFYLEFKTKSGGYQYWVLGGAFDGSMPQAVQNYLNIIANAAFMASQG